MYRSRTSRTVTEYRWTADANAPFAVVGPLALAALFVDEGEPRDWELVELDEVLEVHSISAILTVAEGDHRRVMLTVASGVRSLRLTSVPDWLRGVLLALPGGPTLLGQPELEPFEHPTAAPRFRAYVNKTGGLDYWWDCTSCTRTIDAEATTCPHCGAAVRDSTLLEVALGQAEQARQLHQALSGPQQRRKLIDVAQDGRSWPVETLELP